jgi:hypothetical protein
MGALPVPRQKSPEHTLGASLSSYDHVYSENSLKKVRKNKSVLTYFPAFRVALAAASSRLAKNRKADWL